MVTLLYVIWPGSGVPGPPRMPTINLCGSDGGGAGLIDATSKLCAKQTAGDAATRAARNVRFIVRILLFVRILRRRLCICDVHLTFALIICESRSSVPLTRTR